MSVKIPFLSDEQIKDAATRFSLEYGDNNDYFFPIEDIIELKLRMKIIPSFGLRSMFDIDAYSTGDFTEIVIDDELSGKYPARYRFSLAHEIGHRELHRDFFKSFKFDKIEDWVEFYKAVDPREYDKLEVQGNKFANFLLISEKHLMVLFEQNLPSIQPLINEAQSNNFPFNMYLDYVLDRMATELGKKFGVSQAAALRRLKSEEGLIKMIK